MTFLQCMADKQCSDAVLTGIVLIGLLAVFAFAIWRVTR